MPVSTDTQPPTGDDVVISGISGCFPESENIYQFRDNLFNKVDMVTNDDRRWKLDHPDIPARTGKLHNIDKFDASFFGVHYKQAHAMDPQCRMLLEKTYEAIVDAGVNPSLLKGQNTGVFIGAGVSESEKALCYDKIQNKGLGLLGCSRAMFSNRLSYWLGVHGPSYLVDTACSSSLSALEVAYRAMHAGLCDSAIVGGSNLCLHPYMSLSFYRLGVLSREGICRSFDRDANGYARSEAVCVMFLQKARDAKRVYAKVVYAKTNCDGYKDEGITFPSRLKQAQLMVQFYKECCINPTSVDFIEAHAPGTKVGDPEELAALNEVFCKGRQTPLLIGSVKSNMGHSEAAAGLCSITKVIIAMEHGLIPPNLHFSNPREGVVGMLAGHFKVVTEKQPWNGRLAGVNGFGFGGANAHVLLQRNEKEKENGGAPVDPIPRLVVASGRTKEAVDVILKDFESRPVDVEYVRLMHDLQSLDIVGHTYRGYTLLTQDGRRVRSLKFYPGSKQPVWFVFTGMGSQWPGMGKSLLKLPIFAAAIENCHQVLEPHGVDLINVITSEHPRMFDNILNCFVGIAACQIGLVDILRAVGIEPDGIVGHSVGELGCAYADGCFTAEQMILAAYYHGRASLETDHIKGLMAAVGLGAEQVRKLCPPDIEVACHNGPNVCTLSGPADTMTKFVKKLQEQGVFAKEVNFGNIAYHSKYISSAGPLLLKYLKQVIPHPKPRSFRWVCSSVPPSKWNSPAVKYSSAEYHTNNLLNTVYFDEALQQIPHNAITIEIAPHGLLQAILKRSLKEGITNIVLTQRGHLDGAEFLLTALGNLFELGLQPQLANLYPPVQYPVSRGTPMIAPLVRWEHSEERYIMKYMAEGKSKSGERTVLVSMQDKEKKYLRGHVIDGRNLFPAMAYIELVWETAAIMNRQVYTEMSVVFEGVRFHRATNIPTEGSIEFVIMVQKGTGNFEVVEGGAAVVTGRVRLPENASQERVSVEFCEPQTSDDLLELSSQDIYKELRLRGYNYQGEFCGLVSLDNSGLTGKIRWSKNWVTFMDSMLQAWLFVDDTQSLFVPTEIEKLTVDIRHHILYLQSLDMNEEQVIAVHIHKQMAIIQSGGVEVRGLRGSTIAKRRNLSKPVLEKYVFTPYMEPAHLDLHTTLRVCTHIALENKSGIQVNVVEVYNQGTAPLSPGLVPIFADLPFLKVNIKLLAKASDVSGTDLEVTGLEVEEHELEEEEQCTMVIASNIVQHRELLQTAARSLADGGCILAREKVNTKNVLSSGFRLNVVFEKTLEDEKLLLLRKAVVEENPAVIPVSGQNYRWLPELQTAITNNYEHQIILLAQGEPLSGIMGLVNCIRKEPGGDFARCFFIVDTAAPLFDLNLPLYRQQLNKGLIMNVYSDGKWGSYRHLPLDICATVSVPHAWLSVTPGDLSSFKWLEGNLDPDRVITKANEEFVHIYYSAINFRNVMTATGKLALHVFLNDRLNQDNVLGLEFSGRDRKGRRVMGMTSHGALASVIMADSSMLWDVPDHWTLEDAATVPVVYGTAYYALVNFGHMQKGESVLIHSGSGGVGQAAINICLHAGCTVYTTVGTQEKRDFIKKQFPQLTDRNIGNSRDTSFEQLIMSETNGRGVDIVLNSLAEEKLQASVRCLALGGRFLEIGKFDLDSNNPLGMKMFLKETSFHAVVLGKVFNSSPNIKKMLYDLLKEGISSGVVRPLNRTVFPNTEVEQAFRYMAAGKHIGKVLVQIRPEEERKVVIPAPWLMQVHPRYFCNPNYTYIIAGGLGGFGLELADWLVLRGARKLVLSSRTGVRTGYQSFRVRVWRSYGATIVISVADITTKSGVRDLLSDANNLGQVDAIFNLAVVLRDRLLENQTEADFVTTAAPKSLATHHLDVLSRQMCPHLRHFVMFSSVSCGRGNAGQTNYAMSNSIMERICEARVRDGLPGLAVQWGAVGDVGLLAEKEEEQPDIQRGGTLPQKVSSCLEVLDGFMKQPYPIVASMVVAEKRVGSGGSDNLTARITNIMGIRDRKTISQNSTLAELGMDSMTTVEIKETLEREFEIYLKPQEIRHLTFIRIDELSAANWHTEVDEQQLEDQRVDNEVPVERSQLLLRLYGDKASVIQPAVRLPSASGSGTDVEDDLKAGPVLFMLPGLEGLASVLQPLARNLKYQTVCLQLANSYMGQTVQDIAQALLPHIHSQLAPHAPFRLLGYSFGGLVALELALKLEAEGRDGNVYLVDSAPDFLKETLAHLGRSEDKSFTSVLCTMLKHTGPDEATSSSVSELIEEIVPVNSWDEKIDHFVNTSPVLRKHADYYKALGASMLARLKAISSYKWNHKNNVKARTILVRCDVVPVIADEDYGLSKCCEKKVEVHFVTGNHLTILDSKDTATIINRELTNTEAVNFRHNCTEERLL